jgi:hypothetical protein
MYFFKKEIPKLIIINGDGKMQERKLAKKLALIALAISLPLAVGCKSMITEEQLKEMTDLRAKEHNLTEQIQKKQQEKTKIQAELNSRNAELKKCSDDKAFIESKISQWPNVWPDYTPGKPEEEKK